MSKFPADEANEQGTLKMSKFPADEANDQNVGPKWPQF
jgi:hypothetical protein